MPISLLDLRLSAQRALLDAVWPDLRAVSIEEMGYFFKVYFYHHGPINEMAQSHVGAIITEIDADFYKDEDGTEYCCCHDLIRIDFPQCLPQLGCCIYRRYELTPIPRALNQLYLQKCLSDDPKGLYLESDLAVMLNNALLGRITPNLRSASLGLEGGVAHLHFYFDGAIQPKDEQLTKEAIAELSAEMNSWAPSNGVPLKSEIVRVDLPTRIRFSHRVTYFRHESDPNTVVDGGQNDTLNS